MFPTEGLLAVFLTPRPIYFPTLLLSITGENTPAARGVSPRCQLIGGNRREVRVTGELWASYQAVAALHISSSSENQAVQKQSMRPADANRFLSGWIGERAAEKVEKQIEHLLGGSDWEHSIRPERRLRGNHHLSLYPLTW